jgi:hypothetical protein
MYAYYAYIKMIRFSSSAVAPNPVSWLIFGLISFGNFLILWKEISYTIIAFPFIMCIAQLLIAYFSYQKRNGTMAIFDQIALIIGVVSMITWMYIKINTDHLYWWVPLILIFIADAVGFFPTIRDSWNKPHDDDPNTWRVFVIVCVCILISLLFDEKSKLVDYAYPAYELTLSVSNYLILIFRQRKVKKE